MCSVKVLGPVVVPMSLRVRLDLARGAHGVHEVFQGLDARIQALADRHVPAEAAQVLDVLLGVSHLDRELVDVWAVTLATLECLCHSSTRKSWGSDAG